MQPPFKLTLVVDVERWLPYKGTCHVILLAKLHDMYLYKTDNIFHINHQQWRRGGGYIIRVVFLMLFSTGTTLHVADALIFFLFLFFFFFSFFFFLFFFFFCKLYSNSCSACITDNPLYTTLDTATKFVIIIWKCHETFAYAVTFRHKLCKIVLDSVNKPRFSISVRIPSVRLF